MIKDLLFCKIILFSLTFVSGSISQEALTNEGQINQVKKHDLKSTSGSSSFSTLLNWCAEHHIDVYSKEVYNQLSNSRQQQVMSSFKVIIYEGEQLTMDDIKAYKRRLSTPIESQSQTHKID